jgi:O-antigen ligase
VLQLLPLFVLVVVILFLTVYGAGIFLWSTCAVLLVLSLTAIILNRYSKQTAAEKTKRLNPKNLYAATVLLIAIVLIPMPVSFSHLTGAQRHEQNQIVSDTITAVQSLGYDTPAKAWFSTTRNRAGTLRALLLFATLFGVWHTVVRLDAKRRHIWLQFLIATGTVVAILGHLGKWVLPQGDTLWWFMPIPHALPGPVGGFINPNHFAGLIAMLAPVALATAVINARQRHWLMMTFDLIAFGLMTPVLIFSMSRGGIVAYGGGLAALLLISFFRIRSGGRLLLIAAATVVIGLAGLVAFQSDPVRERLLSLRSPATTASLQERMLAWKDTMRIWRHYPIIGVGPNAFIVTYPQHRTSSSRAARDFAENEYVQIIAETGVVGTLLLVMLFVVLTRQAVGCLRRKDEPGSEYAPAAIAALAAAATHALVDFPLHLPLYAIIATSFTALMWPASTCGQRPYRAMWPHVLGVVIAACIWIAGSFIRLDSPGLISGADVSTISRALVCTPTSPLAWRRLGVRLADAPQLQNQRLGERCLTQAATYDPNNYPLWRRLGKLRQDLGDNRGANKAYRRVEALRDWIKLPVLPEE